MAARLWLVPLGILIAVGGIFTALGPFFSSDPRVGLGEKTVLPLLGSSLIALGVWGATQLGGLVTHDIVRKAQSVSWARVIGARVAHGMVSVFCVGEPRAWAKLRYAQLTNAKALLELIAERAGGR